MELIISGALLAVAMSAVIPTLGWIARDRQVNRQRQAAMLAAGNLMERVALLDWDELNSARAGEFQLPEAVKSDLPESKLTIAVENESAPADAKHVLIEIRWEIASGRPAPTVRLAAWFHRHIRDESLAVEHGGPGT